MFTVSVGPKDHAALEKVVYQILLELHTEAGRKAKQIKVEFQLVEKTCVRPVVTLRPGGAMRLPVQALPGGFNLQQVAEIVQWGVASHALPLGWRIGTVSSPDFTLVREQGAL